MNVVHEHGAGRDGHKKSVVACRIEPAETGGWRQEIRQWGTLTAELLALGSVKE